ncbi:MAG: putative DNA-binding protein (MmcQ/YjbR family) [Planctomycetota bacterium]|jgi:predicted DNA-binding protein (MmcQ/YjbR family)
MQKKDPQERARGDLLAFALGFPEAHEDHPWGEVVAKVRKKVFVFFGGDKGFGLSVKLPESKFEALLLPFTEPTGYGLGKSGWVTARFEEGFDPPVALLSIWIEESYRAVAPKTLLKQLDPNHIPRANPRRRKG